MRTQPERRRECDPVVDRPPLGPGVRFWLICLAALVPLLSCDNPNPLFPSPSPRLGVLPAGVAMLDIPFDIAPDGQHFLYGRTDPGTQTSGVYLGAIPPDSSDRFLMPLDPYLVSPRAFRFSPDSRRIAFIRGELLATRVYLYDLQTGLDTAATTVEYAADAPDWDPSGRYVVYDRPWLSPGDPDSVAGIHIVDTQSQTDRSLRHGGNPTPGGNPRWSPDSSWICFSYGTRLGGGNRPPMAIHIYRVRLDGTGYADLMPTVSTDNQSPSWIRP